MRIKLAILLLGSLIGISLGLLYIEATNTKPRTDNQDKVESLLHQIDSLKQENNLLEQQRTILKQEEQALKNRVDSLSSIRPTNVKNTNNAVKRFYNSDTPAKLAIGDSILRARKNEAR